MDFVGKKKPELQTQKNNLFTDANLRKQQKRQYTQVYLHVCVYIQNITPRERCIQV